VKATVVLLLLAGLLAGCAEINKPITPGDTWRDKATSGRTGPPLY